MLIGFCAATSALAVAVHASLHDEDIRRMLLLEHFRAVFGLPAIVVAASGVVLLLENATGPIKVTGFGVSFEGAAAPIVFWILVFLAMSFGAWLLW